MRLTIGKPAAILSKNISLFLISCLLLTACSKEEEEIITPEKKTLQYLTGIGNRFWRIKEIYVNQVQVTLTSSQLDYNKTYTHYGYNELNTGVFSDSDGSIGTWELNGPDKIKETITNNAGGNITLDIIINHLDANNMDVEYSKNGTTVRSVYFAY